MSLFKCRTDDITPLLRTLHGSQLTQSKHRCPSNGPQRLTPSAPPHSLSDVCPVPPLGVSRTASLSIGVLLPQCLCTGLSLCLGLSSTK